MNQFRLRNIIRKGHTLMKRALLLVLASAGLALAPAAHAHAQTSNWSIDSAHSSINFTVKHGGVSTVHGAIMGIKGTILLDEKDITKSSVETVADVTTVSTGVEARDKHLKSADFFDAANKPTLTFKSTKVVSSGGKLQLIGDLTLAGVTKSVTLDVDGPVPPVKGQGGKVVSAFSATGTLSRTNFDFGQKTMASKAIGDDVKFTIDLEIDKAP
jgi:polyisoprenoid-binding protein YceI